ncbi:hypothetical protein BU23DRAFT_330627 [Bimuria novae-zelandiae CBS 107.79]|uniref:Rhodopsin domain-containing protein n=1 Tax=Bimuria novae-zelandiae CBS 107.79 TaxID=1447943 RepID=A0A6A5UMV9_9PLEO|nr:hypothetical protein BU23DRAFT_330627 [Bimuria novae-zelandiae CBS 107.79]
MFYHPLMGAIRASVIMFLFRVRDQRWHIRWALHVVFWINIGYLVSTTIVNIVQCDPIRYAYMRPQMDHKDASGNLIKGGTCINSLAFIMSSCGLSIFMDLIIMPIPTAMVWNLQMKRRTKLAVVAVMSMGWFATAASVSRLIIYHVRFAPYTDRTHNIGLVTSITEPSIGIIAACAPALRRLFTFFVPRYFSDEGSYDTHGYTQTNDATYGNTRPRPSHSFDAGKVVKIDMDVDGIPGRDEEDVYDMANLKGKVSREEMHMQRTHSVKTGVSESASHPCTRPTEPFGVLNQRQWSGPR